MLELKIFCAVYSLELKSVLATVCNFSRFCALVLSNKGLKLIGISTVHVHCPRLDASGVARNTQLIHGMFAFTVSRKCRVGQSVFLSTFILGMQVSRLLRHFVFARNC